MSSGFVDVYSPRAAEIWLEEFHNRNTNSVWHYTSGYALIRILEENRMRATNIRYLNDASEFKYGQGLVSEALAIASNRWPDLKSLLQSVPKYIAEFRKTFEFYVICFCSEADLLSQWRVYGANGGGFSICFDWSGLESNRNKFKKLQLRSCRVEYEKPRQMEILERLIQAWCQSIQTAGTSDENANGAATDVLADDLLMFLCSFKHKAFSEENEWRLVYSPKQDEAEIKFREGSNGIVPYVELDLSIETSFRGLEQGKLPILEVKHGPTLEPELAKHSLEALKNKHESSWQISGPQVSLRI